MAEKRIGPFSIKSLLLVVVIAVVVAVLSTLIQQLLLGRSMPVLTGAIVGVVIAGLAGSMLRKKGIDD